MLRHEPLLRACLLRLGVMNSAELLKFTRNSEVHSKKGPRYAEAQKTFLAGVPSSDAQTRSLFAFPFAIVYVQITHM